MNSCRPYKTKDMRGTVKKYKLYAPGLFPWRLKEAGYWLDAASATASLIEGKCVIECVTTDIFSKEKIRSQHYCIDLHKCASTELARNVRMLPGILVDTKPYNIINVFGQSSRQLNPHHPRSQYSTTPEAAACSTTNCSLLAIEDVHHEVVETPKLWTPVLRDNEALQRWSRFLQLPLFYKWRST